MTILSRKRRINQNAKNSGNEVPACKIYKFIMLFPLTNIIMIQTQTLGEIKLTGNKLNERLRNAAATAAIISNPRLCTNAALSIKKCHTPVS